MFALAEASPRHVLSRNSAAAGYSKARESVSDKALIEAVASHDRRAMHLLYTRHSVRIYRFLLGLIKNPSAAEDLLSEVFLDVWRQAGCFKGKSQVSTWLLAIARNKAISALRRKSNEPMDDDALEIADPAEDPETQVQSEDRGAVLRKCLAELSPAHREVIDLVYYHDKSVEEVAEIVGIPTGTVKTRMFYARNHLHKSLNLAGVDGF